MKEKKQRTLFYRRAVWNEKTSMNLEEHLKKVHRKLTSTSLRTFKYHEFEIQCLKVENKPAGMFFHVASYIPEQPASLVPAASSSESVDTETQMPPAKRNYMEGDIFFMVSGNDLILLPSGARESIALAYISLSLGSGGTDINLKYDIEAIADINKVKMIQNEGVKKIALNTSIYDATLKHEEMKSHRHTSKSFYDGAAQFIFKLFKEDHNIEDMKEMENLSVRIELSYNSRKKGFDVGSDYLQNTAKELIKDEDSEGFSIITNKGNKLDENQIRISSKMKFKTYGKSIYRKEAFDFMQQYLKDLKDKGVLDQ